MDQIIILSILICQSIIMIEYKIKIFLITFFCEMGIYAIRTIYSFSKSLIASTIQADDSYLGLVDSLFLYCLGLGYLQLAIFPINKPVLALTIGLSLVALLYMLVPVMVTYIPSSSFVILCILMSVQGYFQSWTWPHLLMIMNTYYDNKKQSIKFAFWTTNTNFGSIFGFLICQFIILAFGFSWQFCMITICVYIFFMVILVQCTIQQISVPSESQQVMQSGSESLMTSLRFQSEQQNVQIDNGPVSHRQNIIKILKSPVVILMTITFSFVKSIKFGIMFWLPLYFVIIGLVEYSAYIPITYDIASIFSTLALGYAFSKINNKGILIGPLMAILIIIFALLRFLNVSVVVYFVLIAIVGLCLGGTYNALSSLVAIQLVKVIAPRYRTKYVGFYTAVLMCFGNMVTATFQIIIGYSMSNNQSLIFSIFFWLSVVILILLVAVGIIEYQSSKQQIERPLVEERQSSIAQQIEIVETH